MFRAPGYGRMRSDPTEWLAQDWKHGMNVVGVKESVDLSDVQRPPH
jgi:hypothetical protein